jgi:hypothetical protein
VKNLIQMGKTIEEIEETAVKSKKLTKQARQAKLAKADGKAAKLKSEYGLATPLEKLVAWAKLTRRVSEIVTADGYASGSRSPESTPQSIRIMVDNPELTYTVAYIQEMLMAGMTEAQILEKFSRVRNDTPSAKATRFMLEYPNTYSKVTLMALFAKGMTWEQVLAKTSKKFGLALSTTS